MHEIGFWRILYYTCSWGLRGLGTLLAMLQAPVFMWSACKPQEEAPCCYKVYSLIWALRYKGYIFTSCFFGEEEGVRQYFELLTICSAGCKREGAASC